MDRSPDHDPRHRVLYWTRGEAVRNFGDFLTELLLDRALITPIVQSARYRLVGSALDRFVLGQDLAPLGPDEHVACWGCGARDDSGLPPDTISRVRLFGVRGPLSRAALGLPDDTPLGDPGLLLPLFHEPVRGIPDGALCVPHFFEPLTPEQLIEQTGADRVLSPRVTNVAEMINLIDRICNAELVIAGSLHAAIVAAAYGTPFAFLDTGFVDTPFKWRDFAALVGITPNFARTTDEAAGIAAANASAMVLPPTLPLLGCCPWAIRPSVLFEAARRDAAAGLAPPGSLTQDSDTFQALALRSWQRSAKPRDSADVMTRLERLVGHAELLAVQGAAELAALRFTFLAEGVQPSLPFTAGTAGQAMLASGWSSPNAVGAVSHGSVSTLRLPESSGWQSLVALTFEGYLYSPVQAPFHGARRVIVHANGVRLLDTNLVNPGPGESFLAQLRIVLPHELRGVGGSLQFDIAFEPLASPRESGTGPDERQIGIALLRIVGEVDLDADDVSRGLPGAPSTH